MVRPVGECATATKIPSVTPSPESVCASQGGGARSVLAKVKVCVGPPYMLYCEFCSDTLYSLTGRKTPTYLLKFYSLRWVGCKGWGYGVGGGGKMPEVRARSVGTKVKLCMLSLIHI